MQRFDEFRFFLSKNAVTPYLFSLTYTNSHEKTDKNAPKKADITTKKVNLSHKAAG